MELNFKNISIPYILSEKSEVWNQDIVFKANENYHIKANSGKGKSSLVHTLYGINKNYQGTIYFDKKNVSQFSMQDWSLIRSQKISIVFQDLKLFEKETALFNLLIKNELTQYTNLTQINHFAERLNVAHTFNRPINTLSYGERQRIAIIRALLQPFEILLLDEPFSHLDEQNSLCASQLICEELKKRQALLIRFDLSDDTHFSYHKTFQL